MNVTELTVGQQRYRIVAIQRDGSWAAYAERPATGERFGLECTDASESLAVDRIRQWLEWQHEHTQALEALQAAGHSYHRTIAGSAFANETEGPTPIEMQKESLQRVEAARLALDAIRARRPNV